MQKFIRWVGLTAVLSLSLFLIYQQVQAAPQASPGDVIINEIMQNPSAVSDGSGEWFELYNTTGSPIDLNGWTIADNDTDSHLIASSVIIPANGYVVLGNNSDSGTNGGVTIAYSYSGIALANGADEIVLLDDTSTEIDRVEYDGGPNFPDPNGASMSLISPALDNNVSTNWCTATTTFGSGDAGTPNAINDCVPVTAPELTVSKQAPASALAGQTLVYTISVGNTGSQTADTVLITDTLPSGLVYDSDNTGMTPSNLGGNVYQWNIGSLNAGVTNTYQLTTTIPLTMPNGLITNNVEVSTSTAGDNTANNTASANTQIGVILEDIVSISKQAPAYGVIGEDLTYTIEVINNSATTETVTITDTLPISLTYVSDTSGVMPYTLAGNSYLWMLPVAGNSTTTFNLTANVNAGTNSGEILTNAIEIGTIGNDNPADNSDTANTTVYSLVTIYDIQQVPDPATDDSSPLLDDIVWVEGVVTAPPGEIDTPSGLMYLQDPSGGAWSGIAVYRGAGFPETYALGSHVRVLGVVQEFFGSTQVNLTNDPWQIAVLGQQPVPAPQLLTTGDFPDASASTSEQWEGVYLQFSNISVTDDGLGFGEWHMSDGSGNARVDDLGSRDNNLTYTPANGDTFDIVRGIAGFSFNNYKLYPRNDQDLIVSTDAPILTKQAPANVAVGAVFTYTLTVDNFTGVTLTNLIITDVVPTGTEFAFSTDGGVFNGTEVEWVVGSLPDQTQVNRTFAVTTTASSGSIILNDDYWVTASNFLTETYGTAVATTVGDSIPISTIQGDAFNSPLKGTSTTAVGVVTGFFEGNFPGGGNFNGFFIQDPIGDGDSATSDGLFVNHGTTAVSVSIGDIVSVTGQIEEFSEFDLNACTEDCMTQIYTTNPSNIVVVGTGSISPVVLNPVQDTDDQYDYFEALEGMLVTQPATATVVGPTSFGTIYVLAGSEGVDKAFRDSPQHGKVYAVRHYERFGDIAGGDPPNLIAGSVVNNVDGPLMTTYGPYVVITQASDEWQTVSAVPLPATAPTIPAPQANEFSVASFNMLNLDTGDAKLPKVAQVVADMGCPSIIGLQEVDTVSTLAGSEDTVLGELVTAISNAGCSNYASAFSHPDIGDHGVAILWNVTKVLSVTTDSPYQGCNADGSGSTTSYDPISCPAGELPTFSRRPLVLTGTVQLDGREEEIIVVANHFKSQLGGAAADNRRLAQAQIVRGIVDNAVANGNHNVVVLGDLNDFYNSDTLNELVSSGNLIRLWDFLPAQERYSYIFRGISQALDHILVTPTLYGSVSDFNPHHIDADYPAFPYGTDNSVVWRASDHDPLVALFQTDCTAQAVTLTGVESGNDLLVSWNTLANNTNYDLYQLTIPYGDPLTSGSLVDGTQMTTINTPLTAGTAFYQVVAKRGICSGTPASTNTVGEFTFSITPGTP